MKRPVEQATLARVPLPDGITRAGAESAARGRLLAAGGVDLPRPHGCTGASRRPRSTSCTSRCGAPSAAPSTRRTCSRPCACCRRSEGERRLAAELDRTGSREAVTAAHARFLPLNRCFGAACTDWQVRPTRLDPMALNDHTDWRWDERVLRMLASLEGAFCGLCDELAASLSRFDGYGDRFSSALREVEGGRRAWLDAPDRDSCSLLWIQFHEDLLATLGIPRGSDT